MNKRTLIVVLAAAAAVTVVIVLLVTRGGSQGGLTAQTDEALERVTPTAEAAPRPTPTPGAVGMEYLLSHSDYSVRLSAVRTLPRRTDIPVETRAELLVSALRAEVDHPSTDAPPVKDAYLGPEGVMRLMAVRSLSELGAGALPPLRDALAGAAGLFREHLLVALVYLGDAEVLTEVRELVVSADDVVVRMDGARALGVAGDREAIPALEQALQDAARIEAHDSLGDYTIYPVREQAALALSNLGVTVSRGENHTFLVEGH
ncbi:MAG: HEAT repeat domain-containing protein [Anaerolineae bacterium]